MAKIKESKLIGSEQRNGVSGNHDFIERGNNFEPKSHQRCQLVTHTTYFYEVS